MKHSLVRWAVALMTVGTLATGCSCWNGAEDTGPQPTPTSPQPTALDGSIWSVRMEYRWTDISFTSYCRCPDPAEYTGGGCYGTPHEFVFPYQRLHTLNAKFEVDGHDLVFEYVKSRTFLYYPPTEAEMFDPSVGYHKWECPGIQASLNPPTGVDYGRFIRDGFYVSSDDTMVFGEDVFELRFKEPADWSYASGLDIDWYSNAVLVDSFSALPGWGDLTILDAFPAKNYAATHDWEMATFTVRLTCVANCGNRDCTEPCDDGNPCTNDECVEGEGCRYTPRTGSCPADECHLDAQCVDGICVSENPIDCDDENPCTDDFCDPSFGCLYMPNSVVLNNASLTDCWVEECIGGVPHSIPTDAETPVQGPPDDCFKEICVAGQGLVSVPDATEPGCSCDGVTPGECDDRNPCTVDTCDVASGECVNTPDDTIGHPRQARLTARQTFAEVAASCRIRTTMRFLRRAPWGTVRTRYARTVK